MESVEYVDVTETRKYSVGCHDEAHAGCVDRLRPEPQCECCCHHYHIIKNYRKIVDSILAKLKEVSYQHDVIVGPGSSSDCGDARVEAMIIGVPSDVKREETLKVIDLLLFVDDEYGNADVMVSAEEMSDDLKKYVEHCGDFVVYKGAGNGG